MLRRKSSLTLQNYLVAPPRRRSVEDELENNSGMMEMLKSYYNADAEDDLALVSDKALLTVRHQLKQHFGYV